MSNGLISFYTLFYGEESDELWRAVSRETAEEMLDFLMAAAERERPSTYTLMKDGLGGLVLLDGGPYGLIKEDAVRYLLALLSQQRVGNAIIDAIGVRG